MGFTLGTSVYCKVFSSGDIYIVWAKLLPEVCLLFLFNSVLFSGVFSSVCFTGVTSSRTSRDIALVKASQL